jgi:hypothetical protein
VRESHIWTGPKTSQGCGKQVRILPKYAYCNRCAELREQGYDV